MANKPYRVVQAQCLDELYDRDVLSTHDKPVYAGCHAVAMKRIAACPGWMADSESEAHARQLAIDDVKKWLGEQGEKISDKLKRYLIRIAIETLVDILLTYLKKEYGERYAPEAGLVTGDPHEAFNADSESWGNEADQFLFSLE